MVNNPLTLATSETASSFLVRGVGSNFSITEGSASSLSKPIGKPFTINGTTNILLKNGLGKTFSVLLNSLISSVNNVNVIRAATATSTVKLYNGFAKVLSVSSNTVLNWINNVGKLITTNTISLLKLIRSIGGAGNNTFIVQSGTSTSMNFGFTTLLSIASSTVAKLVTSLPVVLSIIESTVVTWLNGHNINLNVASLTSTLLTYGRAFARLLIGATTGIISFVKSPSITWNVSSPSINSIELGIEKLFTILLSPVISLIKKAPFLLSTTVSSISSIAKSYAVILLEEYNKIITSLNNQLAKILPSVSSGTSTNVQFEIVKLFDISVSTVLSLIKASPLLLTATVSNIVKIAKSFGLNLANVISLVTESETVSMIRDIYKTFITPAPSAAAFQLDIGKLFDLSISTVIDLYKKSPLNLLVSTPTLMSIGKAISLTYLNIYKGCSVIFEKPVNKFLTATVSGISNILRGIGRILLTTETATITVYKGFKLNFLTPVISNTSYLFQQALHRTLTSVISPTINLSKGLFSTLSTTASSIIQLFRDWGTRIK